MEARMESESKRKGKAPSLVDDSSFRKRKPLSDCSNILAPGKSSSITIPKPTPNFVLCSPSRTRQVKNSTVASNPRTHPAAPASVPRTPSRVSSGPSERAVFKPRSVYTRKETAEKRKDKGKAVAVPVSSVFKRLRDDLRGERVDAVTKPHSKPRVKKNHGVSSGKESSNDLEEYVRQQKSYFEEIDAFELLVEEASDKELE